MSNRAGQRIWLTPVSATLAIAAAWLAWWAAGSIHEFRVVDGGVEEVLAAQQQVDVVVNIGFPPERFHAAYFRDIAPVGGRVKGSTFYLRNLDRAELAAVARPLWVESVKLWKRE